MRNPVKREQLIHSGTTNDIYSTNYPNILEIESTDRISAANGKKTDIITGKGVANNSISMICFRLLNEKGIPTHFIEIGSNAASKLVYKAEMIPLEVIGRFYATGSFAKRYQCENMLKFDNLYIEFTHKCDATDDPLITEDAIIALGILTANEIGVIKYYTEQMAYITRDMFSEFGVRLIDFKIEFGKLPNGQIAICDEICPDTCRLVESDSGKSLDKDSFRNGLSKEIVESIYKEILYKLSNK